MTTDTDPSATSEATSLRDDISQAWDDAQADESTPELKAEEQDTADERPADETPAEEEKPADEEKPEEAEMKDEPKAVVKAPASWKPELREKFSELPEDVRNEVLRVEASVGKAFRDNAGARQIAENFYATVKPYQDVIEGSGVTPFQAVQETLEVAKRLRTGTPRQKAEVLAELYSVYDIDLTELNEVLTAKVMAPKPSATEQAILDRLERLDRSSQPAPRPRETAPDHSNSVNREVEDFATKNEFFSDVSSDMELLLTTGKASSLKEAYDKAVRMNDGVQKVLETRKLKDKERATAGAASVKGSSPKGRTTPAKELSLRDTLSKAYDDAFGA